nr:radical SAM protein [Protofrankia coriariae]
MLPSLDEPLPARHLLPHRNRYFIGELDPCASVEFTRGCPWDCSFCSAWTFYGRSYRRMSPDAAGHELASIREPNVFLVDDVAFIKPEHGMAIADQIERRRIRKRYYLETRADVLLRHPKVFQRWHRLGLTYMFLGMEALDAEGLDLFHKRISPDENIRALELARRIGITVAVNLIADPDWDAERFRLVREWALSVPEIVHLTVITPYPGTEIWHTQSQRLTTLDYRLFDIQHAVTPTRLPLDEFYRELVATQAVLNRKHLGIRALAATARTAGSSTCTSSTAATAARPDPAPSAQPSTARWPPPRCRPPPRRGERTAMPAVPNTPAIAVSASPAGRRRDRRATRRTLEYLPKHTDPHPRIPERAG